MIVHFKMKEMCICKLMTQDKFAFAIEHMYSVYMLFLITEFYMYIATHYMYLIKDV